ncbi:MAG TPA: hypothetical protein VFZ08_05460 [Terriglobia bacterium]|nr:hypothetical protein [Terriglobia bacterium]
MNLLTASHGSYPRIGEPPEQQILRRTITECDRGGKSERDVRAAEDEMTELALREQAEAGIDVVSDGLIRWNDPISHLAGKLSGVRLNGLLRFFDTNFYFRQPVVGSPPQRTGPLILDEFKFARNGSARPVKPVLTGPYTLARHSLNEKSGPGKFEKLLMDYTEALSGEIAQLAAAGARFIQVDEPSLLSCLDGFSLVAETLRKLASQKGKAELWLTVYFGDAVPIYEKLQTLPVDVLGLDFSYNSKLIDMAAAGSAKTLCLGLLDGRNTKLEDVAIVAETIGRMLKTTRGASAYLSTSCGLEYLPRDRAFSKLKHLARIKAIVEGSEA